jgi:pyruvate dehydrogenase E1 component
LDEIRCASVGKSGFLTTVVAGTVSGRVSNADLGVLARIERRILWLATRIVDFANHERPNGDGMKVGGHEASSASMVSIMTALWFGHLDADDFVAVKPHASPVLHAINYLIGTLGQERLTQLREFGGLQSYPSRTKDPFPVDYSTGSVGLGAAAPLFGAVVADYLKSHFGTDVDRRFIALIGDAELDEGNVWEAIADPITEGHGNVMWVVDLNRQSLDRIVPGVRAGRLERMFADNGWHVIEAKYGRRLRALFERSDGEALRAHLDAMANEQYQSLFSLRPEEVRERFLHDADAAVRRAVADLDDATLHDTVTNLGGHDLGDLVHCYRTADADPRPSVVFAYTVKGWGLPIARLNHAALLSNEQIAALRSESGLDETTEWDRFPAASPEGEVCRCTARRLQRAQRDGVVLPSAPADTGTRASKPTSTQDAFGRILVGLTRVPELAPRIVTTSPDVTVSTNLGGWVNKVGVFSRYERPSFDDGASLVRWEVGRHGQHLELGISEMNLFLLLGQLGLAGDLFGEPLVPIGTVYDPFVLRGLDAFIYGAYSDSRFIVVGTPSGVTLSYEGGAHQSLVTPSVGMELPNVSYLEPGYVRCVDWLMCDAIGRLSGPDGESAYLRLSTRPIDQAPFEQAVGRLGEDVLRRQALAGGYCLHESSVEGPLLHLAGSGAVLPEILSAAFLLEDEGVRVRVLDLTSPDRLFRAWRALVRHAVTTATRPDRSGSIIADLFPPGTETAPIVTVHDAAPHCLAWLGSIHGASVVPLGVERFGQSGGLADVYKWHELDVDAIVNASLYALDES